MVVEYVIHRYTEDGPVDENGWSVLVSGLPPAWRAGEVSWVEEVGRTVCCADMDKHLLLGDVAFGDRKECCFHSKSTEVFIRVARGHQADIPLPYCPWCTQPVITMDMTGR